MKRKKGCIGCGACPDVDGPSPRLPALAKEIREEIEADFTDRRGLRQEWEQIDDDIQDEIRATWEEAIVKVLRRRLTG